MKKFFNRVKFEATPIVFLVILFGLCTGMLVGNQMFKFIENEISIVLKNPEAYEIKYSFSQLEPFFQVFGVILFWNFGFTFLYIYDHLKKKT